jgi:hypothetical protein
MSVDVYTRTNNNDWLLQAYENTDEVIRIPCLDLEWPLQALYEEAYLCSLDERREIEATY